ncbi:FAD-binding protein [Robertmurraya sp. DFI.2.37]|uniref:FAD-binding protein n=1 Tax=Robertmurraya sp. DFI.2.37 TaxID=3031819 RepID=UPI0012480577|nr:FAD-binding protein [Robertmurraya sp. DFI.2.37]MDF1509251.1 FAD-binding protein [Robertmurraya sp. DFI.2.37]
MYDEIIVGQGLTGLLTAIWSREEGKKVALVSTGLGKIFQSAGVFDILPGEDGKFADLMTKYKLDTHSRLTISEAAKKYFQLTERIGYPYQGGIETPITIITGSGHLKETAFYPDTIKPIPEQGHVVIVGFEEVVDFLPKYVKGNLQKSRPSLHVDTMTVSLGKGSSRTMSQLDAAYLLDQEKVCQHVLDQIKIKMADKKIAKAELFIFPAALGFNNWRKVLEQATIQLQAAITEAPGMPPNATAIRLHDKLKKEAIKLGVRFYENTTIIGAKVKDSKVQSVITKANLEIKSESYVIATGGILGGGIEKTATGYKDKVLGIDLDQHGRYTNCPENVWLVGASNGMNVTQYGITGGVYSILSCYETYTARKQRMKLGGLQHA